jgi:hypothetical protein
MVHDLSTSVVHDRVHFNILEAVGEGGDKSEKGRQRDKDSKRLFLLSTVKRVSCGDETRQDNKIHKTRQDNITQDTTRQHKDRR